jgi:beta-1,4-mannosyl-glycoprotein beta-1,4-N-acetylglucosaminyltransferase
MTETWDTVILFNELDMLELRLNILDDVVDHFVICEATETHSGLPKPLNLLANWDRFKPFHRKIVYINAGELSNGNRNSWQREYYHRTCITQGLHNAQPNDFVIVSDVDEIPDPEAVSYLKQLPQEADVIKFELAMYYYDMNHRVDQGWAVAAMRFWREMDPNKIRTCAHEPWDVYAPGGWHFSWFGGAEQIIAKHSSFMHHNDNGIRDLPHDPVYLANVVSASKDLFGRDLTIEHVINSDTLPKYVLDNMSHYRDLGWIE